MCYMGPAIRATYGVADPTASHGGPFSYATSQEAVLGRQSHVVEHLDDVGPQNQCAELQNSPRVQDMA